MFDGFDLEKLNLSEEARQGLVLLLNLLEELKSENDALHALVQRLRDEINRLKGEQGKPEIKPNKKKDEQKESEQELVTKPDSNSYSSESERQKVTEPRPRKKSKRPEIKIDREEVVDLDPEHLPADAQFKGYEEVVVQDIKISTDNVLFKKAKYYSPSTGRTYLAELPTGYDGQFGPGIKAFTIILYFMCNMTQPKILDLFDNIGCQVSSGQLSNFLIKNKDSFHAEKEAVYEAGLESTPWQHLDDTGMRVDGQNQHTQIVCNPFYTIYFTTEKKDRLSVIDTLLHSRQRFFRINQEAHSYLERVGLSQSKRALISQLPHDKNFNENEFLSLLAEKVPGLGLKQQKRVLEAAALAYYHSQQDWPIVSLLICDDAPQFKSITDELALCWIHDGRHYKKLNPYVAYHRKLLDQFLDSYWRFYHELNAYRQSPDQGEAARLRAKFVELFSTETGYDALDERIAKTLAKQESLLAVLDHPEIPLHNNPAELGARHRVRKRVISAGTRSQDGTQAWDTFMSLAVTTKKLGISFFNYINDRIRGTNQIPALAEIIKRQAEQLNLGASFDNST